MARFPIRASFRASLRATSRRGPAAGFSLPQVMVAIVIAGILGGLAVSRWTQAQRRQALILEGKNVRAFLQEARAYGAKKSLQVGVSFDPGGRAYRLFEDRDGNGQPAAAEVVRTLPLGKGIAFGIAASGPATAADAPTAPPASGLAGSWARAWISPVDLSAAPAAGGIYLRHDQLRSLTVNLRSAPGSRAYLLSLWNGSKWVAL